MNGSYSPVEQTICIFYFAGIHNAFAYKLTQTEVYAGTAGWMSHSDIHSRPLVSSAVSTVIADNDLCPVLIQIAKSTG